MKKMKNILKRIKHKWKGWRIYEKDNEYMKRMKNVLKGWRINEKDEEYVYEKGSRIYEKE